MLVLIFLGGISFLLSLYFLSMMVSEGGQAQGMAIALGRAVFASALATFGLWLIIPNLGAFS